jgi:FkbM family methyltransferase
MLKISCLCPTFNRAPHELELVEEAIESFLRQDYPNKELLILNDAPGQTLHFEHPQVRIVNTPFRCADQAEKQRLLAGLAAGELLCPWADDAISLPWRLSRSRALLGGRDYYAPREYWYLDAEGPLHDCMPIFPYFASLCRTEAVARLEVARRAAERASSDRNAWPRTPEAAAAPSAPIEDWHSIYRWGVARFPPPAPDRDGEAATGEFPLSPHWNQDYATLTRSYAAALHAPPGSPRLATVLARDVQFPLAWRLDSSDYSAMHQILWGRNYDCLNDRAAVDLIIDCGANAGYASAYFLSRFPRCTVIAVEPHPANFTLLRHNLAPYGQRARAVEAGVWDRDCPLVITQTPYRDGREWSRQVTECRPGESSSLRGVTIPALLADSGHERISILKMDIEGAEGVVFSSCTDWLRCVDCILIELHDDSHFGTCSDIFFRAIAEHGFTISATDELTVCKRPT